MRVRRLRLLAVPVLTLALTGGAYAQYQSETPADSNDRPADATKSNDAQIHSEVQKQIDARPALKAGNIKVEGVQDGVVYLNGRANTGAEKHQAEELAMSVPGVRKVHDTIEVTGRGE